VLGNWQARFWRPVERGDPSAEFNQPQGDHLTGPEMGLGVFGDGAQLPAFCAMKENSHWG